MSDDEKLREALEAIQWGASDGYTEVCPACGRSENEGHNQVCRVGAALAAPTPAVEQPFHATGSEAEVVSRVITELVKRELGWTPAQLLAIANDAVPVIRELYGIAPALHLPAEPQPAGDALTEATKAIDLQLVVKSNSEGRYFVSLLDSKGDHLFSAPHWSWYEGTVQHRDDMVKRIAEIFTPVIEHAADRAAASQVEELRGLINAVEDAIQDGEDGHSLWFKVTPVLRSAIDSAKAILDKPAPSRE